MKHYVNSILLFSIVLLLWLLSGFIFEINLDYYNLLSLPNYTLSGNYISIIWFIIYITNSISIILILRKYNIFKNYDYLYILLTTYLSSQLFLYFFFYLMSPFLGFIITVVTFISSIFWFLETKKLNKLASYFVLPYIIYSLYAVILMTHVYVINF
ncbi:MAG: tryptophan-rich sensory protein [Bacilli bacterium]|nr:tryptophan-rich sensory protein [Bacilli bacterium]